MRCYPMDRSRIDDTLVEIGRDYKPGLLAWLKGYPSRWRQMLDLECRINQVALSQEDEISLRDVLKDYRLFFQEMTNLYVKGSSLFRGKI